MGALRKPTHYTSDQFSSTSTYGPGREITEQQQSVPVVPLSILAHEQDRKALTPVIDLPKIRGKEDGKITSDTIPTFLVMLPEDFLDPDKITKPIQINIIEHEDYIDYEIEFAELSMDQISELDE